MSAVRNEQGRRPVENKNRFLLVQVALRTTSVVEGDVEMARVRLRARYRSVVAARFLRILGLT
jgi:hypothetical protein